ncbi:MAG TPA: hypothetical protein VKM72_15885 [Thermoanaerobaculia bacterium]|nr:hypothetical protein [Thermoanaerobaculia bacterium]
MSRRLSIYEGSAVATLAFVLIALPLDAQTVIWTTDPGKAAVLQGAGIADQILAEQERLRTTPMVHRKIGLRPAAGEEVVVRSGEVIVARLAYQASYMAKPRADFVSTSGTPIRAEGFRVFKMLNNRWCGRGGRCYEDKDRDGDWDGAGQARGRWVDVPYESMELRKPIEGEDRRELMLLDARTPVSIEYREWMGGSLVNTEACAPVEASRYSCHGLAVTEVGREDEAIRFLVEVAQ